MRERLIPVRDAAVAGLGLLAAVWIGSGRFRHLDPALLGYLGAVVVATVATAWRLSAFWRRPASAVYGRALRAGLARPATLRRALAAAADDLVAQRFVARRGRARWLAHLCLSGGTLSSLAITLPLVCGWLHFVAAGPATYRVVVFGVPTVTLAVGGPLGWLVFHALLVTGVAVAAGSAWFLALRLRHRGRPGTAGAFHAGPLVLLLVVAATGLALPAAGRSGLPHAVRVAAAAHELSVVALLLALPFSKLSHLVVRPLQLGARLVRAPDAPRVACATCGAALAPRAQHAAVAVLLAGRGLRFAAHPDRCPPCRRRLLAATQAALQDAGFQPPSLAAPRPAVPRPRRVA